MSVFNGKMIFAVTSSLKVLTFCQSTLSIEAFSIYQNLNIGSLNNFYYHKTLSNDKWYFDIYLADIDLSLGTSTCDKCNIASTRKSSVSLLYFGGPHAV